MIKPQKIIGILVIGGVMTYFRLTAPPPPAALPRPAAPAPGAAAVVEPRPALPTANTPYVRIVLTKAGTLSVDGKESSLPEVGTALDALAAKQGVVLYAGQAPAQNDPPPAAQAMMELVLMKKLPIRVCRSADFADDIAPDGKLRIGD